MVILTEEGKVALDSLPAQAIAENRVPGAYFAAATADRMLYSGSAGLRSFRDPTSCKVAIIQLIEASKITFETSVDSIVAELANPVVVDDINALEYTFKPAQNKILIKRLLNHSSGLHYVPICRKASPESLGPVYTAVGYKAIFRDRNSSNLYGDVCQELAVVYGTQVALTNDPEVVKLWGQLESALYAGLKD